MRLSQSTNIVGYLVQAAALAICLRFSAPCAGFLASVDENFAPDGLASASGVGPVEPLPNGKLYVFTYCLTNQLIRLNSFGGVDSAFRSPFLEYRSAEDHQLTSNSGFVRQMSAMTDGRVLITGRFTHVNGEARTNLVRLSADGTVDSSFRPTEITNPENIARLLAVEANGRIIVGQLEPGIDVRKRIRYRLVRLEADGSLDRAYNVKLEGPGVDIFAAEWPDQIAAFSATLSDGRLVVGGRLSAVNDAATRNLVRLNADGSLDPTFVLESSLDAFVTDNRCALQPNGKILLANAVNRGGNGLGRPHGLVRLHRDGSLDRSFAVPLLLGLDGISALAGQPDGKVLVAALDWIYRLNLDGLPDPTCRVRVEGGVVDRIQMLPDGQALITGSFKSAGGLRRAYLAKLVLGPEAALGPTICSTEGKQWDLATSQNTLVTLAQFQLAQHVAMDLTNVAGINSGALDFPGLAFLQSDATALTADGHLVEWVSMEGLGSALWKTNVYAAANVVGFAGNVGYLLAVTSSGTVRVLREPESDPAFRLNVPLTNAVAISGNRNDALFLKADGTVFQTGLGVQTTNPPPANLTNVVAVAMGGRTFNPDPLGEAVNDGRPFAFALKEDGTITAWGDNELGQTDVPAGLAKVVAIAAGYWHGMALTAEGTVVTWGAWANLNPTPPEATNVIAIAATGQGFSFSPPTNPLGYCLALRADGSVVAWGNGFLANDLDPAPQTAVVPGISNVLAIAAGPHQALAIVGQRPPSLKALLVAPAWDARGFRAQVVTQIGKVYRLEYKDSLTKTGWTSLPLVAGTAHKIELIDLNATGTQRLYRVRRW